MAQNFMGYYLVFKTETGGENNLAGIAANQLSNELMHQ
jgi:hypothetical protein